MNTPTARTPQHVMVVGTGVAGLASAASAVRAGADVTLVTLGHDLAGCGGNTQLAQGGIAAAIGLGDTAHAHAFDTVRAGAGLVDPVAATTLTRDGAQLVRDLITRGFAVDRDGNGFPALGLEGAHGVPRIVHAGEDRTGAALHEFLRGEVSQLVDDGRVALVPASRVDRLVTSGGVVRGISVRAVAGTDAHAAARPAYSSTTLLADAVVLATGGYAALYDRSTNTSTARGDGVLLAARSGALLADLEFVQFHPTVLRGTGVLISEAVRGAGATLIDHTGRRIMQGAHPSGDLAPRDVVAREMHRILSESGELGGATVPGAAHNVWLDATALDTSPTGRRGELSRRFPAISRALASHGYDWAAAPVPVAPAAHYSMGGVITDLAGRTSLPGLFAAGEVAATGVHGANRLASNSLLEGLVFGARAGRAAALPGTDFEKACSHEDAWPATPTFTDTVEVRVRERVREAVREARCSTTPSPSIGHTLSSHVGIVRDADGLKHARHTFQETCEQGREHADAATVALLITEAALARTESRGAHQRSDYPESDPRQAVRRAVRLDYRDSPLAGAHSGFSAQAATVPAAIAHLNTPLTSAKEPHPC